MRPFAFCKHGIIGDECPYCHIEALTETVKSLKEVNKKTKKDLEKLARTLAIAEQYLFTMASNGHHKAIKYFEERIKEERNDKDNRIQ